MVGVFIRTGVSPPRWSEQTEAFRQGCLANGAYLWRGDLARLQVRPATMESRVRGTAPVSPLSMRIDVWRRCLSQHPDEVLVVYILKGLEEGFSIGYDISVGLRQAHSNLPSANNHPQVVEEYLQKEWELGRVRKCDIQIADDIHVNPFGVIPKKAAGKWRLIVYLSAPKGHSVNDGIAEEVASLSYVSVDNVIIGLGAGFFFWESAI